MNNAQGTLINWLNLIFTMLILMFSYQASALEITVTAKVTVPPCIVNNGNMIDVDFGDAVMISKIDGQNYRTIIPYTIQCDASAPDAIKLRFEGVETVFNTDALQTSQAGLGIVFFQNGQPMPINSKLSVSYKSLPIFEVAPIKDKVATLVTGEFTAGATLAISYN